MIDAGTAWAEMTAIHDMLHAEADEVPLSFVTSGAGPDDWPEWYARLITKMFVLLNSEQVVYASSSLSDREDVPAGSAVAFTPKRVVLAEIAGMSGAAAVTTWTRKHIKSVAIDNLPPLPTDPAQHDAWPSRLRSEVVFDQGFSLYLPFTVTARPAHSRATLELLRQLAADLK